MQNLSKELHRRLLSTVKCGLHSAEFSPAFFAITTWQMSPSLTSVNTSHGFMYANCPFPFSTNLSSLPRSLNFYPTIYQHPQWSLPLSKLTKTMKRKPNHNQITIPATVTRCTTLLTTFQTRILFMSLVTLSMFVYSPLSLLSSFLTSFLFIAHSHQNRGHARTTLHKCLRTHHPLQ